MTNDLPEYISMADILKLIPFTASRHWILTQVKKKKFPQPTKLNRKVHLFLTDEVRAWVAKTFKKGSRAIANDSNKETQRRKAPREPRART